MVLDRAHRDLELRRDLLHALALGEQAQDVALCLYRVAQEALRNVASHAGAQNVTLSLDRRNGHITMQVADDGRGFDPAALGRQSGLGLVSLGERVRTLGGELDLRAAPDAGTRLAVVLPAGGTHAA